MTHERWKHLMDPREPEPTLTAFEAMEGWHYCPDWDGLLIGPGWEELHACTCPGARHVPRPPLPNPVIGEGDL